ncbi:MAG: hydrogenase formation protein HypD [Deltaproteobacteria bacterium]|nr:hydrogenase formation protein HypD [Deltaproteobacteria bacterium]
MGIRHVEEYRDPKIARGIADRIRALSRKKIRLMEVCGTHTVSIFRNGIRGLLPASISLLSGPGCPVCVTAQNEIDACIAFCRLEDVIITTFGDLMRVPGTDSSLQKERARGRDVRVVYSTFDALEVARKHPDQRVVFLGVGFETTAPTIAASILSAREQGIENYLVFSAHKLIPPALTVLMEAEELKIDGLILPGHVSVIIGVKAYLPLVEKYGIPCAVAGFEPVDILQAVHSLVDQIESGNARVDNCYPRAVAPEGNPKAQDVMNRVFETKDAVWRGIGSIPGSGLGIRREYSSLDAQKTLHIHLPVSREPNGCACGEILTGAKIPPECPLYRKACTPSDPVGPCMVSSEGTCAAYYRYHTP